MNPENLRKVIFTLEATGPTVEDGHRIIELAAVEMIHGQFTFRSYRTYLNPDRAIDEDAQAIHGISAEMLEDAPRFEEIAAELSEFLRDCELIVHSAPFHVAFLDMELELTGQPSSKQLCTGVTDTLTLARQLRPEQKNDLDTLIDAFGLELPKRTLHGAELDAHLIGSIYLELKKQTLH